MSADSRPIALLLTPVWPQPGVSGRALRAWDWLQTLSKDYQVHVLVDQTQMPDSSFEFPAAHVWPVPIRHVDWGRSRLFRMLGSVIPLLGLFDRRFVLDWAHWDIEPVLAELSKQISGRSVQRIVTFRFYLHDAATKVAQTFSRAQFELDMDDLESSTRASVSLSLLRMGRYREALRSMLSAIQYAALERWVIGAYQVIWLASADDCQALRTKASTQVHCRPNRIPSVPVTKSPSGQALQLLFVGTLNYPPNEEAVQTLICGVLPELRLVMRDPWRLCIVGRCASASLIQLLHEKPEVDYVGDAQNISPWYESSNIVLVPLRSGGGTKLKTIEAFAHARALVSTPHGVRGLGAVKDTHYLEAESPQAFAKAIVQLVQDQALSERIAMAGWTLINESQGQS